MVFLYMLQVKQGVEMIEDVDGLLTGDKLEVVSLNGISYYSTGLYVGKEVTFLRKVNRELILVSDEFGKLPVHIEDVKLISKYTQKDESVSGVKYDQDKLEYSLLPTGVINKVVKVLGFGAKKYAKDNWKKVDNANERYYNAAMRHLNQWWEGEKYDQETGENHLAHALCCLMFLLWLEDNEGGSK